MENTQFRLLKASPPAATQGNTRDYLLFDGRNASEKVTLEYHVWTEGGIPKDAYLVKGSTRVLSYNQVQDLVQKGTLVPLTDLSLAA